jgi:DNA repair exonuclease SbcCD ATPase subunit
MSKDLKDLIEMAEEDEKTRAQLEENVETLKREIAKLNKKLKEKTSLAKIDSVKPTEEFNESEEIYDLKDLIASQKQELTRKVRETEALQQKMEEVNLELEHVRDTFTDSVKNQVLIKTQNSLNNLIEDYGRLEGIIKSLSEKISELDKENKLLTETSTNLKSESSNMEQLEAKIYELKKQLNDFERSKKLLEDNIHTLKSKQSSVIELEKALESLENRNIELKEEKQQLKTEIKAAKTEIFKFSKKEERVSDLKDKIEELKKENINLKEKDTLLLAKTITAINVPKREQPPVLKDTLSKIEKVTEVDLEVKQEKAKEQTEVLPLEPEIISDLIPTDTKTDLSQTSEPKELLKENEIPIAPSEEAVTRKKTCPNCGNTNKAQIREIDDKTRLIYTYPKIYAKMYKCGQCGAEWRK